MGKPVLIFTGGTLSAVRASADGLVSVSERVLDPVARKIGYDVDASVTPYTIDSIKFNIGFGTSAEQTSIDYKHYPKLLHEVEKILKNGDTPVICGGTDSLAWYSTLLTKDLMRRGYLGKNSGQKAVFLSSMKCFNDDIKDGTHLVENTLRAGKSLAENPALSGGLALSAEDPNGNSFVVHDVTNHFDKVSSHIINALRSAKPAGRMEKDIFQPNVDYQAPTPIDRTPPHYARVAPPLLAGQDISVMIDYIKAMTHVSTPFDAVVIEGAPPKTGKSDDLVAAVNDLKMSGTRVLFCNPMRYDAASNTMRKTELNPGWDRGELADDLRRAGAEFTTRLPKDAWLDAMLTTAGSKSRPHIPGTAPTNTHNVVKIRYVPDTSIMAQGLDAIAPMARNIVMSALPNAVIPNTLLAATEPVSSKIPALRRTRHQPNFYRDFEYRDEKFPNHLGEPIKETITPTSYEAAVRACHTIQPVTEMQIDPPATGRAMG